MTEQEITSLGYQVQAKDRWATVFFNPAEKTVICQLRAEYIPIEFFKLTFQKISELVINGDFEKFVFDKRSLKAFHQPSMEWYFVNWKREMLDYGLKKHRKLPPEEAWFRQLVAVAWDELIKKYPPQVFGQLDIKYCESLSEALES